LSYITIIWSVVASCALLLALIYGMMWVMDRQARASLAFACMALAIIGSVVVEIGMMHARTPEAWGEWVRWSQVPIFVRVVATVTFIRLYFGVGRNWLMGLIIALRLAILLVGFAVDPNFIFERIDSIEQIVFLGETVTVLGDAVPADWQWVATFTSLLFLVFVIDASVQLWRTGSSDARRKAIVIGGATFISAAVGTVYTQLMIWQEIQAPVMLSPPYLIMLGAMTFELSRDTLRASRLTRELRDSEARLDMAASAAGLGLWAWDSRRRRFWMTSPALGMFGFKTNGWVEVENVRSRIHPDDVERVEKVWREGAASCDEVEVQFRVMPPDGSTRWIAARGRAEIDSPSGVMSFQGVLRDVTEQLSSREEIEELRRELAHAGRVSVLGTLSSSLVHELSQPLGAILLNTEAGELLLQRPDPDLEEIRQILADIRRDDSRAAEVIDSLRRLLKRRQLEFAPVSVEALVQDVAVLMKSDAIARNVTLECRFEAALPQVRGDRVHLSQVLINMVMNGMDAVADMPSSMRQVTMQARANGGDQVELAVIDSGTGVPDPIMPRIFEPFFTTKAAGMGMGLSVSRTIVDAHGGKLWAENRAEGGATFRVTLPAMA
jgi:two-component system, LuxR family, sensor kinase FixL